jgi:hypothetical protein
MNTINTLIQDKKFCSESNTMALSKSKANATFWCTSWKTCFVIPGLHSSKLQFPHNYLALNNQIFLKTTINSMGGYYVVCTTVICSRVNRTYSRRPDLVTCKNQTYCGLLHASWCQVYLSHCNTLPVDSIPAARSEA